MSDPLVSATRLPRRAARSNKAEIRNPLLRLPAAQRLLALSPEARHVLADLLIELAADARERADQSWARHKAPMAAYWKAVSVYAGHLHRILHRHRSRRSGA